MKGPSRSDRRPERTLPWQDLGRGFKEAGWIDLTHTRASLEIKGVRIGFRGTDDAHIDQDRYADVAGPIDRDEVDVAIGVTHAPYRRVLDAMTYDGHDLIIAGHTHGGQVCVPFYGALVTNCDLDTRRAKGLSQHSAERSNRLAECLCRSRDVPVRPDPLRLPARGDPAHLDERQRGDFCRIVRGRIRPS